MIFQNIDFHNVEELLPQKDGGYLMARLPTALREKLNPTARDRTSLYGTGVELRFKIRSGEVDLYLQAEGDGTPMPAFLYYGAFQAGYQHYAYTIENQETRLHIVPSPNLERLQEVTQTQHLSFQPDVIRLVLPSISFRYLRVEGDIEPPDSQDVPRYTYLAYGSSISHGSLSLGMPHSFVFQMARRFQCDYLNLALAGSAHLEKELAEYIISRKDWHFATMELGINMLNCFTDEEFEIRLMEFLRILSQDSRPIFVTSLFEIMKKNPQAPRFREIVRRHVKAPLIFTEGLDLLENEAMISEDMVHPSLEGAAQIAQRWGDTMMAHHLPDLLKEGGKES